MPYRAQRRVLYAIVTWSILQNARDFWVEIAYDFGCELIHLSKIHDYETVDPFAKMAPQAKQTIINFLRGYHQYQGHDIDLPRFVAVVPKVMGKIRDKVREYSSALEQRGQSPRK